MEEYGNNGICGVDRKQMRAVDGKQEVYLEWPKHYNCMHPACMLLYHDAYTFELCCHIYWLDLYYSYPSAWVFRPYVDGYSAYREYGSTLAPICDLWHEKMTCRVVYTILYKLHIVLLWVIKCAAFCNSVSNPQIEQRNL